MNKQTFFDQINKKRKLFLGITLFEVLLFSISIILATYFTFKDGLSDIEVDEWIIWIDLSLGIIAAISLSRKWKWSWLLLLFDSILYGVAVFLTGNYALGIVNAIISPIILLLSIFTWKNYKQKDKPELITRKLSLTQGLLITGFVVLITIAVGFITIAITNSVGVDKKLQDWLGAFAATITLFAMVFSIMRYRETWYLYFFSNTVKIIMFSLLIIYASENASIVALIMAITYFINSLYGMIIWRNGEKETLFKHKDNDKVTND